MTSTNWRSTSNLRALSFQRLKEVEDALYDELKQVRNRRDTEDTHIVKEIETDLAYVKMVFDEMKEREDS
jgi:hypothetical protein